MELFKRFEFKYPITEKVAKEIEVDLLIHGMIEDPYPKTGHSPYLVNSLYLDSPTLSDFFDKEGGFLNRKKIRIRIYEKNLTDQTSPIMLEKKIKHDMTISKKRLEISIDDYEKIIKGESGTLLQKFSKNKKGKEIMSEIVKTNAKPTTMVRYKRKPFKYSMKPSFRITFDSKIEACQSNDLRYNNHITEVSPGTVIMEVKFDSWLPWWFGEIVKKFDLERDSFSKYARSLTAIKHFDPLPR